MERADIQGLVFSGYREQPFTRLFFVRLDRGQPLGWLRRVVLQVSSGAEDRSAAFRFNLAFSARGLEALGLGEDLPTFAREFQQGMAHPERSRVLGDADEDHPRGWEIGSTEQPIHALALLYARTQRELEARAVQHSALLEKHGVDFAWGDAQLAPDGREHFGYRTGLSQPYLRKSGGRRPRAERALRAGEFVLGYRAHDGSVAEVPSARRRTGTREHPRFAADRTRVEFGKNGSYLVLRKLSQDPAAFWRYAWQNALADGAANPEARARLIASRFVGRWPSGASLVQAPIEPAGLDREHNQFGYRDEDPLGQRCPLGAHVRRAHPRDSLGEDASGSWDESSLHRLIRRGRSYGPKLEFMAGPPTDDGARRGLYFMALNAHLHRQFEFVQQTWLNGSSLAGLSHERDPLVGKRTTMEAGEGGSAIFTAQADPLRVRYERLPKFVQVRGGEYLFLPGLRALNYLCDGAG